VRFAYLCDRSFDQFDGQDPVVRRCAECQIDVLDLDRLTPAEQTEWLDLHARIGEPPCVTTAAPLAGSSAPCKEHPSVLVRHLTGRVALPVIGEAFRQELLSHPSPMSELQRRYQEVEPRRQALLAAARQRVRGG
jgi:hypothetical protein